MSATMRFKLSNFAGTEKRQAEEPWKSRWFQRNLSIATDTHAGILQERMFNE